MNDAPTGSERRSRSTAGLVLVLVGLGLLWMNFTSGPSDVIVMTLLGAGFLAWYIARRSYGMLVPGCILLGIALGRVVGYEIGLGLGFLAIFFIDLAYRRAASWWPVVPGGILIVLGFSARDDQFRDFMVKAWPILLILLGVLMLTGVLRHNRMVSRGNRGGRDRGGDAIGSRETGDSASDQA